MGTPFVKMHGLGNDFVIIDQRDCGGAAAKAELIALSDRHRGIGCNQIIYMQPPRSTGADVFLDMYNADGSTLEACGNGTRCVARLLMDGRTNTCVIETVAGLITCTEAANGMVQADMGAPRLDWQDIPLSEKRDTLHLGAGLFEGLSDPVAVNVGNPHCVFFVDDVNDIDLGAVGPQVENHKLFPRRVNVEFAQIISPQKIRMRVWERGAGITEACGSGACATIVAAVRRDLTERNAEIVLDGGSLFLEWRESDSHILMTGPAAHVFSGVWEA